MEWLTKRNAIRVGIAAVIFTIIQPAHADNTLKGETLWQDKLHSQ